MTEPQTHPSGPEAVAAVPEGISASLREYEALTPAQKGELTKKAKRRATGFRIGDQVLTNTPRSPRFHNRAGTVVATNLGEVGVAFSGDRADAWFLPSELTRIRTTGLLSDLRGTGGL